MSVIPNMLVTGILPLPFSLVLVVWSAMPLPRRYGGVGLILLSVVLLLVGGGLGPPLMLLVAGAAATRVPNPLPWWPPRSSTDPPPLVARLWRAALVASVIGYLSLLPAIPIADQLIGPVDPVVVGVVGLFAFATFFLAVIAALAWDSYHSGASAPPPRRTPSMNDDASDGLWKSPTSLLLSGHHRACRIPLTTPGECRYYRSPMLCRNQPPRSTD